MKNVEVLPPVNWMPVLEHLQEQPGAGYYDGTPEEVRACRSFAELLPAHEGPLYASATDLDKRVSGRSLRAMVQGLKTRSN